MNCRQMRRVLADEWGRHGSEREAAAIQTHLRRCPACRRLRHDLAAVEADLRELGRELPVREVDVVDRAIERVLARPADGRSGLHAPRAATVWRILLANWTRAQFSRACRSADASPHVGAPRIRHAGWRPHSGKHANTERFPSSPAVPWRPAMGSAAAALLVLALYWWARGQGEAPRRSLVAVGPRSGQRGLALPPSPQPSRADAGRMGDDRDEGAAGREGPG